MADKYSQPLLIFALLLVTVYSTGCNIEQVRLSLGDNYYNFGQDLQIPTNDFNDNEAYLVWQSKDTECPMEVKVTDKKQKVVLQKPYDFSKTFIYTFTEEKDGQTGSYASVAYTCMLTGLEFDIEYSYEIVNTEDENDKFGPISFELAGQEESTKKIFLVGDMDYGEVSQTNIEALTKMVDSDDFENFAGIIQLGDIAYNLHTDLGSVGDNYFNAIQPFASKWPFIMTPGNHDYYNNWNFLNFRLRDPLYNFSSNQYYSINWQGIHFVFVNYDYYENTTSTNQQKMFDWIKGDLEQANTIQSREKYPFLVVVSHKPIYCLMSDPNVPEYKRCYYYYQNRKNWEGLYTENNVDLVLAAHQHDYERMKPIYRNQSIEYETGEGADKNTIINPGAPIYIIEGVGGRTIMKPYEFTAEYGIFQDGTVGYGTLQLQKDENYHYLVFEQISSENGDLIDNMTIKKSIKTGGQPSGGDDDGSIWGTLFIVALLVGVIGGVYFVIKKKRQDPTNVMELKASNKQVELKSLRVINEVESLE